MKNIHIDFKRGQQRFSVPLPNLEHAKYSEVNSVLDAELTPLGAVLFSYECMLAAPNAAAPMNAVFRYCRYLHTRGFDQPPQIMLSKVLKMSKRRGIKWINKTFKRYVGDDAGLVDFLFGGDSVDH